MKTNRLIKYGDGDKFEVTGANVAGAALDAVNAGIAFSQLYPNSQQDKDFTKQSKLNSQAFKSKMHANPLDTSYIKPVDFDMNKANKEVGKAAFAGGTAGLTLGSTPLLVGLTGGLSVPIAAAVGTAAGAIGGLFKKKKSIEQHQFTEAENKLLNKDLSFWKNAANIQNADFWKQTQLARNGAVIVKKNPKACAMKMGAKMKSCGCGCDTKKYRRGGEIDVKKENVILAGPSHDMNNGLKPGDKGLPLVRNGVKIAEVESLELVMSAETMKDLENLRARVKAGDEGAEQELADRLAKELSENTYDYTKMLI